MAGTKKTKHIFAGDELIATVEVNGAATAVYYDHTDHLGGSSVLTNATGAREQLLDYYPFGGIRLNEKSSTFDEQRKFTGQEYDSATSLHYYGQRYYNQDIGRFTSQDPVFLSIGTNDKRTALALSNPQLLNSYSYVGNNPLKYVDEEGELGFLAPLLVAVVGGLFFTDVEIAQAPDVGQTIDSTPWNPQDTVIPGYSNLSGPEQFGIDLGFGAIFGGLRGVGKEGVQKAIGVLVKHGGKEVPVYRGGSITYRPSDFKNSLKDGFIDPSSSKTPEGISVNINPKDPNVLKYGGPNQVTSLPEGLEIVQSGRNPEHFVIRPIEKIKEETLIKLVHKINQWGDDG